MARHLGKKASFSFIYYEYLGRCVWGGICCVYIMGGSYMGIDEILFWVFCFLIYIFSGARMVWEGVARYCSFREILVSLEWCRVLGSGDLVF